jgi:hypothetical protein
MGLLWTVPVSVRLASRCAPARDMGGARTDASSAARDSSAIVPVMRRLWDLP